MSWLSFFRRIFVVLCVGGGVVGYFVSAAGIVHAQSTALLVSPVRGEAVVGDIIALELWLKPGDQLVDTVIATLRYPEDLLVLETVEIDPAFSVHIPEYISTKPEDGVISVGVAIPSGTVNDVSVARVVFRSKKKGTVAVQLRKNSRVLRSGYDVPVVFVPAQLRILTQAEANKIRKGIPVVSSTPSIIPDSITIQTDILTDESKFVGAEPVVKGKTTVPGARISLVADHGLVRDEVRANGAGEWEWRFPTDLPPGRYLIEVVSSHPRYPSVVDRDPAVVEVRNLEVAQTQYDLALQGPTKPVTPGSMAPFTTILQHFGSTPEIQIQTPAHVVYSVEDGNGNPFFEEEEDIVIIGPTTTQKKEVAIPADVERGLFTFRVELSIDDELVDQDQYTFRVEPEWITRLPFIIATVVGGVALIGGGRFVRRRAKRKK